MKRTQWIIVLAALALGVAGCGDDDSTVDGGLDAGRDGGRLDAGPDSQVMDDAGDDAGDDDGGMGDGGMDDAGDAGMTDAGMTDDGIAAVRGAAVGAQSPALEVRGVTVTYVRPVIGEDPAGFFVQAERTGPALFVTAAAGLDPVVAAGDVVDFDVTETADYNGVLHVSMATSFSRSSTGASLTGLVQDVSSAADLVSAVGDYVSEYVLAMGTLGAFNASSGTGHDAYTFETAGVTGNDNLQLRLAETSVVSLGLGGAAGTGCEVTVGPSPLWRFRNAAGTTDRAQLMGYADADIVVTDCPDLTVVGAEATNSDTVVVTFSRPVDGAAAGDFALTGGLTVSSIVVSADGTQVTLTLGAPMMQGTSYTVTVTGVTDAGDGDAIGTPNSAMFTGVGPSEVPGAGDLVITEVFYNFLAAAVTDDTDREWIELHNPSTTVTYQLMGCIVDDLVGGGAMPRTIDSSVLVGPGEYVAMAGSMSGVPASVFEWGPGLNNTGDSVVISCGGTVVDQIDYTNAAPWPTGAEGISIQLSNARLTADNNVGANWCLTPEGTTYGPDGQRGTPGAANLACSAAPVAPTVVSAMATSATTVVVSFSEALDGATVAAGDFMFNMGLTASAVVLAGDGLSATVTTSAQTAGSTYMVIVTGVSDTMGTAIAGMNTATFAGFTPAGGMVPTPGDLVITEIMQNPAFVDDTFAEYVELYNASSNTLDLNGLVLRDDGADSHTIANGGALLVAPGEYIVLGRNANTAMNGGIAVDYQYASFQLGNGDDEVVLATAGGTEIVRAAYDGGPTWPDPTGASMQLNPSMLNAAASNMAAAWCTSTVAISGTNTDLGTPGAANSACP